MKIRMAVARCCCDGVAPPPSTIVAFDSGGYDFATGQPIALGFWTDTAPLWGVQIGSLGSFGSRANIHGFIFFESVLQTSVVTATLEMDTPSAPSVTFRSSFYDEEDYNAGPPGTPGSLADCRIFAEDADDAAYPRVTENLQNRVRTTASTGVISHEYDEYNWTSLGAFTHQIDVTAPVAEVLSRPGWVSGNSLLLLFDLEYGTSTANYGGNFDTTGGINPIRLVLT